ncbi:MAG: D-alanyl-D-alanine carboxypeptidase [Butyrivibrio sp.]|nr:D-alanyl-D-alanine carboxypeptidase [Butyrivibrio sp.]
MSYRHFDKDEQDPEARRARRLAKMKREKKRQALMRGLVHNYTIPAVAVIVCVIVVAFGIKWIYSAQNRNAREQVKQTIAEPIAQNVGSSAADTASTAVKPKIYVATADDKTQQVSGDVVSSHAVLIDLADNRIAAQKGAMERINPASMTKVLTVLVAAEHVKNLNDKVTITLDDTDFSYSNDCSSVGFSKDEQVTVKDLFYGTVLASGADAAVALATYVGGSQNNFVAMMNDKLKELGLSDTAHFTNCVGIYDKDHYCTVYDMAMILEAALDNDLCREVLSTHTYTTSATLQHPDGITISNWFLRRIEDKDCGGKVECGKTGYVVQSGNCAASYAQDPAGKGYICVTAGSTSAWRCIFDHIAIYTPFLSGSSAVGSSGESSSAVGSTDESAAAAQDSAMGNVQPCDN